MPTYSDLLKLFEEATRDNVTLVLPHPIEEIFPEKVPSARSGQAAGGEGTPDELLKKAYEDLVNTTFRKAA
jgi:hypothetical protein